MEYTELLLSAAVLVLCGAVCIWTLLTVRGKPISKRWIRVEAELRPPTATQKANNLANNTMIGVLTGGSPAHRTEPDELFDAVYYVEHAAYHKTVHSKNPSGTVRFYVDRADPDRIWAPRTRLTKPQAVGILLICAMLIGYTVYTFFVRYR